MIAPRTISKPILIAGPTASGKSGLAMTLAEELGGAVINADSMQVYSELRILTARPSPGHEACVPHKLYGHVPAAEAYSAGRFVTDVTSAIAEARHAGQRPIIVGGTGLYFKALLEGLSPVPAIPNSVRLKWRALAETGGANALWQMLTDRDTQMAARLEPNDAQRIVRALEVMDATGKSLAEWQQTPGMPVLAESETIRLVVQIERDELLRRIDLRVDQMMNAGALAEVRHLAGLNLRPELPAMRALGVRPLMQHMSGALPLEQAIGQTKAETRQYAKRQLTWLKGNMCSWKTISTQQKECVNRDMLSFIN